MLEKLGSMRSAYGEALVELGASNPGVVVLGADTTESMKSGMFGAKYPDRFFNLGIAESEPGRRGRRGWPSQARSSTPAPMRSSSRGSASTR